jgi:hypothetical protein
MDLAVSHPKYQNCLKSGEGGGTNLEMEIWNIQRNSYKANVKVTNTVISCVRLTPGNLSVRITPSPHIKF